MRSIRSRTLVLVLGLLGVSLAGISWLSYRDAKHETEELFDAQLAHTARLLEGMVGRDMTPAARRSMQQTLDQAIGRRGPAAAGHPYGRKVAFLVVDRQAGIVLQSAGAPAELAGGLHSAGAGTADAAGRHDHPAGYRDVAMPPHRWRVFTLQDIADGYWIVVGERDDVRGELVDKIALGSLLPDLVGLPLLALLVWLAIGWSLKPLKAMAESIRARDPDQLAPLQLAGLPQELQPMVAALNRLLLQLDTLLAREKRFLADAAHELRTPLAVLRIHAQNALDAPDPGDRAEALRQMLQGVDRATRLVAQLLTLARLEPGAAAQHPQSLELQAFLRNELAELTPLALERGQELTLVADEGRDVALRADPTQLGVLLQNLVGNAIQHTPPDGRIQVVLKAAADTVEIDVQDSGPGVAAAARDKLFERFYRAGGGTGAGLGLSIAQRVVELHHGSIALADSPLGGLEVRVRLPRNGAPQTG